MSLFDLVTNSLLFLPAFDYDHYPSQLDSVRVELEEILGTNSSDIVIPLLDDLLNDIDELVLSKPRLKQKGTAFDLKQVLAIYIVPAAIQCGDLGHFFADELVSRWNSRHPTNTFQKGNYETIMKGFDANLLGLPLRKSKKNRR